MIHPRTSPARNRSRCSCSALLRWHVKGNVALLSGLLMLLLLGAQAGSAMQTATLPTPEEAALDAQRLYLKMQHYSSVTSSPMTFVLSDLSTRSVHEFGQTPWLDVFDLPDDEIIHTKIVRQEDDILGIAGVTYRSAWQRVRNENWSELRSLIGDMSAVEAVDLVDRNGILRAPIVAVTSFAVEVTLDSRVKTYRAAMFWIDHQKGGLDFVLQDHIVPAVRQVRRETYEPVPIDIFDGFDQGAADAAETCVASPATPEDGELITRGGTEGHWTGSHGSFIEKNATCENTQDCRSFCKIVTPIQKLCYEVGWLQNLSIHRTVEAQEIHGAPAQSEGARCQFNLGCAIEECFLAVCGSVSLSYNGVKFEASTNALADMSINETTLCPVPAAPPTRFFVRFNSQINESSSGMTGGSYTARLRTWLPNQSPASDPANVTQKLPVAPNGLYTFPSTVKDEHHYRVDVQSPTGVENCQVVGGAGQMNGSDVNGIQITCDTSEDVTTGGEGFTVGGMIGGLDSPRDVILKFTADLPGEMYEKELTVAASSSFAVPRLIAEGTPVTMKVQRQPLPQPGDEPGLNIECAVTQIPNPMPARDVVLSVFCENNLLRQLELDVCERDPGICFVEDPDPINFRCSASRDTTREHVCTSTWNDSNGNGVIDPGETSGQDCSDTFIVRTVVECWDSSLFGGFLTSGPAGGFSTKAGTGGSEGTLYSSGPHIALTAPHDGDAVQGVIYVAGFAMDYQDGVSDFYVGIDGQEVFLGDFQNGMADPNWCDSWPGELGPCLSSSFFHGTLDTRTLPNGPRKLEVVVVNNSGSAPMYSWASAIINVDNDNPPPSSDLRVTNNSGSITIAPGGQIGFGSTTVGVPKNLTLRIHNDGQTDLTLSNVTVSGDFTILVQPPAVIAPGDSGTFKIRLQATQPANPASGTVSIYNNAAPSPYAFTVKGTVNAGPARIDVIDLQNEQAVSSGATIDFAGPGAVMMSDLPMAHILRIHNDGGQTLNLSGLSISGPNFWLGTPLPTSIPGGEHRDLHVHLGPPPAGGEHTAHVTFSHNGSNPPASWTIHFSTLVLEDLGCPGGEPPPCP